MLNINQEMCSSTFLDEIGYMDYDTRFADLLFEVVSERYQKKSTIITTNKIFSEWSELFPTAACVVSLVDKLVHNSEIVVIEGKSYRLHEAEQRTEEKNLARKAKSKKKKDDKLS
jgi:DNA replication protein DnaC